VNAQAEGPLGGPRLYGNWRSERGWGIGSLSTSATIVVFLAVLAPVLAVSVVPYAALPLAGLGIVVTAVAVRLGGVTIAEVVVRRARFVRARTARWTELCGGVLTEHPRAHDLPGVLAPLVPLDVDDGRGGRHSLLWNRRTGTLSVVLRCSPIGLDLADPDQVDEWIASWGALLADLGYQPLVQHVAVTIDTAPTGGTTMRDYVSTAMDPQAPALARTVLEELVALTPATAAKVDARFTITMDPNRGNPKPPDLLAAVVDVGRWLPGIENALATCGVAVLGRATTGWLTGRIRAAFDPVARPEIARLDEQAAALAWAEVGPVAATENWETYCHDSGNSVSWALREAPRQAGPASHRREKRRPNIVSPPKRMESVCSGWEVNRISVGTPG
jgi:hypothetical protein